ncbi:MAG: competence/damage-inducible protein A [Dehalococcoidales bacterium]|nr:MAG: competence/damage-inducible protein A [Dehalococcoidales bacterium]
MRAEIVSVGTEILLGEITDTNSSYLARQLPSLGIDLYWISQVGDNQSRLVEVLKRAWQRSDLVLTSGGLGPTEDDITREAIAEVLGEKIGVDPSLEQGLRERFSQWHMAMPLSNLKQATIIPSAKPIPNTRGTAPGWWVSRDDRIIVAMPGPPAELQEMWQREVRPALQQMSEAIILSRVFKTSGLSEAAVGEMVAPLLSSSNPTLAVYSKADGIQLRLTAKAASQKQAEQVIAEGEIRVRELLDRYIWGTDDDTLETAAGRLLIEKGLTLSVIEDYSGGWLAASITDIPQSPVFFRGGLVACSDQAKIALGVDEAIISRYGAVSPEMAQSMAEVARELLKSDIAISTTGLLENENEPAGVTYIGISDGENSRAIRRSRGKRRVTTTALLELRRLLTSSN